MRSKLILVLLMVSSLLVACSTDDNNISVNDHESIDIKELVNDYSTRNITSASASITSSELKVTSDDGDEEVYELPEDEFFLSIAPFIEETHH